MPPARRRFLLTHFLLAVLLAGVLAAAGARPAAAQDDRAGVPERAEREVSAKFYPWSLYGEAAGFGIGAGVEVENVPAPGVRLLATARPAQHEGRYALALATADLRTAPRYARAEARYLATGVQWFYGLGPAAGEDRIALDRRTFEASLRYGVRRLFGQRFGPFLVEPRLGVRLDVARGFEGDAGGTDAFAAFAPASRANVRAALGRLPGSARRQRGLLPGLRLAFDTRDRRARPSHGIFLDATAFQYESLDALDLRFRRYDVSAAGFVPLPLGDGHVLAARARLTLTDRLGAARVPFYLLPMLGRDTLPGIGRDRFFGRDRFLAEVQYRRPLVDGYDLFRLEGLVGLGAGSVYDDLADQFELGLTFDETLRPEAGRYALRPVASVGLRALTLFRDQLLASAVLGVSPDGVTLARFRFVVDGLTLRPTD